MSSELAVKGSKSSLPVIAASAEQYPMLAGDSDLQEVVLENFGEQGIGPDDLPKIRIPAGGGLAWMVGDETEKKLEGIILHISRRRAYWPSPNPTGDPPACTSSDCVVGIGEPGGLCSECPLDAFKSARRADGKEGRGKACKESKLLFLLRPGRVLPEVVVVTPGSLDVVRDFLMAVTLAGKKYWSVVTSLTLEKATNKDGIAYAKAKMMPLGALPAETLVAMKTTAQKFKALFNRVTVNREDLEGNDQTTEC